MMVLGRRTWCALVLLGVALTVVACAGRSSELEPRYVAVHNALAATGHVQVGPIQQGSLGEGAEARLTFELGAECTSLVVIAGEGVRDVDATVLDSGGRAIAHDTTSEPQAIVHACLEVAGTYTLVVKMARGAGTYLAGAWAGGGARAATAGTSPGAAGSAQANGTCESPIPLVPGTVNASTSRGEAEHEGTCVHSDSKELVYKLELRERQRVAIDVSARFDTVLYVRKDDCVEASSEVACNDDAPDQERSKIDTVLEPGTYYVFVDGYGREAGPFRMQVSLTDVPSLADVCHQARPLMVGAPPQSGTTAASFDHANAACGGHAKGNDVPYRLDLATRSRVRIVEHSDEFSPVVHLRRACADERSELACSDRGIHSDDATYVGVLDPGSYTVFADGTDAATNGRYTLQAEIAPEHGGGIPVGDGCADAIPLATTDRAVTGDTFAARDDVSGKCSGAGAPDMIYRVDLTRRSRLSARMNEEEGRHVIVLFRNCGDPGGELSCGTKLDEVLSPGTYFLAVDGASKDAMGQFKMELAVRDAGAQEAACRNPPLLAEGRPVTGNTSGAGDKFMTSCGGREDNQASSDRIYKLVVPSRAKVRITLTTPTWDGVLVLRKACMDTGGAVRNAEVHCNNDAEDSHHSRIETTLDAGTYFVLVDGHASGNEGAYTLEYKIVR